MKSKRLTKVLAGVAMAGALVAVPTLGAVDAASAASSGNKVAYGPYSSGSSCYKQKAKYTSGSFAVVSKYCYLRAYNDGNGKHHKDYYFYITYRTH